MFSSIFEIQSILYPHIVGNITDLQGSSKVKGLDAKLEAIYMYMIIYECFENYHVHINIVLFVKKVINTLDHENMEINVITYGFM